MKEQELDELLNSKEQQELSRLVKSLPDDSLSLSWRSELNSKLRVQAEKTRKRRIFWMVGRPVAGLSLAAVCALALFVKPTATPVKIAVENPHATIESTVASAHKDEVVASDLGITLSLEEDSESIEQSETTG